MTKGGDTRAQVALILKGVLDSGRSLSDTLDTQLANVKEPALARALVYGVLRDFNKLQWMGQQLVAKPLKPKDNDLWYLILTGIFQLYFSDVAAHAAISQTVNSVKALKKIWARGLVNATLRNAQRQQQSLTDDSMWPQNCHIEHPHWLVERIRHDWGEQADAIFKANNQKAPMWLRVNARQLTREQFVQQLKTANLQTTVSNLAENGLLLDSPVQVSQIPGFESGDCSVQDESAQLAAQILGAQSGERILDLCAAPGGKACHLAELCPELEEVVAVDVSAKRLQRVVENVQRLQLCGSVRIMEGDATQCQTWWDQKPFDRILLDVPCSATGVIRRHPDIKYLRHSDDIASLSLLQRDILNKAWPLLKPGGRLLYASCSILSEENHNNINQFLADHTDAAILPIELLDSCDAVADFDGAGYRIFPSPLRDGFYYCLIEKK